MTHSTRPFLAARWLLTSLVTLAAAGFSPVASAQGADDKKVTIDWWLPTGDRAT